MKKRMKMKRIAILVVVVIVLVAGSLLASNMILAKNPFNGLGKVLVQGSPISGTNGMMFDDDDMLYIASVVGREIVIMDPKSGRILDRLGVDEGVEGPDDLTFGPDGHLYWTEILQGNVARLEPDGTVTRQLVAQGVNPITFSDDGRLFVALDFLGDGLYELDPELLAPPKPIIEATPGDPYPLGFLNGMDFGPDGLLYGPLWVPNLVVRIDVDLKTIVDVVASGLSNPAAVKFDSQGNLYVAEQMSGEVSRLDLITGEKTVIATGLFGLDNIAFDSRDRLFVSSMEGGSIYQVLPSGKVRTVSKGGMTNPVGVAVMPNSGGGESVFVADLWTLREFDGKTGRPISIGRHNLTGLGITSPMTVSVDGNNLILSSWFGHAVQVWDPTAQEVLEEYFVDVPLNAIRFMGDIVVAEPGRVFRAVDDFTIAEELFVPVGLAATDNDLWVSEWITGTVWQIVDNGDILEEPIRVNAELELLSQPEGLAVNLDGNLLVVEAGAGRLSSIDLDTGEVSVLVEDLALGDEAIPGTPPTGGFDGVAVGPSGYIYVTGNVDNVLYRFKPTR